MSDKKGNSGKTTPVDLIVKKRDGHSLSKADIKHLISGYVSGSIPDYQMSSFLMAVYFQGMRIEEIKYLTQIMIDSGDVMDISTIPGIKVDKHSTGGVGDKVSLILAPLVAAAGVPVPMMSGRGLGHSGGTLDKLEAIPGFRTDLTGAQFYDAIKKIGFAMIGQSKHIVPADQKIYALRDVTATVPSLPLICSSIISKKKAEGTDALVLDVKFGRGAFCKTLDKAIHLAKELIRVGSAFSIRTVALLTRMEEPLGYTVGNWVETREAISTLQGGGPSDLMQVVKALSGLMLLLGGKAESIGEGVQQIKECLSSGEGFRRFRAMVKNQGGDLSVIDRPDTYPAPKFILHMESPKTGYIADLDAFQIGMLANALGAGRTKIEDPVDPGAGIVLEKKRGDFVHKGDLLATMQTNTEKGIKDVKGRLLEAFVFSDRPPDSRKLIEVMIDENGKVTEINQEILE
jgi:pyrimidine-nucleoside phosphorylase